jgi:heptosyltransferase III
MPPGRNILVFHAGALGDFLITWPLALALARIYPQSRLFYVTQRGKGLLAERVLRVESVDAEAGWHPMFAPAAVLPEPQAKLLAGAHSVVSFVSTGDDAWAQNVRRLAPSAELTTLVVSPPADFTGHVTDHLLAQLSHRPAAQEALAQVLRSVASRGVTTRTAVPNGPVVIHPGSGARRKCWPVNRFLDLISLIRETGRDVRVVLGEVELETWDRAEVERISSSAPVAKPNTYVELLAELTRAAVFVGNDTGPSHLAGIIGIPTVALFGASNPTHWRPLGPNVRVVQASSIGGIDVNRVYAEVREALT